MHMYVRIHNNFLTDHNVLPVIQPCIVHINIELLIDFFPFFTLRCNDSGKKYSTFFHGDIVKPISKLFMRHLLQMLISLYQGLDNQIKLQIQ